MLDYQAGYRAGRSRECRSRVDLERAEASLNSILDVAKKLGNHNSIQLIKHEIRKEMESLRHEACNERSR